MAISEHATGSQAATVTTEHFLGTDPDTTDGVFQFFIDVAAMVLLDILEIRIYEKARSGDTARPMHVWRLAHAQTDTLWVSPTLILMHGWRFSIKQTAGTSRTFLWSIRKVA
jgi:hypothetical protein